MKKMCMALVALLTSCVTNSFGDNVPVCTVSWPPYTVHSDSGEISGTHTNLTRQILQELSMTADIKEIPWKRCLKMAEKGKVAFVYSASRKTDREAYMAYPTKALQSLSYVVIALQGTKSKWGKDKNPLSLKMPVSIPLGFSIGDELTKAGVKVDSSVLDDRQSLDKLLKGRVPVAIIELGVLDKLLAEKSPEERSKIKILYPAYTEGKDYFITVSDAYFGGRKQAKVVTAQIDRVIQRLGVGAAPAA
ncbi:MAG: transporter substrate-binding domain-containing protein [bacterium]|nr:transporter substrate-binding domain-containing protein [bacterium]